MDLFWCISKSMGETLTVLITVQCCEMNVNLQFARKEQEFCPKKSYCIMTTHVLTQQQRQYRQCNNWASNFFNIHLPYSPELAPSNYHIFGPLKEALRGRRLASDEEVKEAVHNWLREQSKSFFSAGIQKLVERYNKRIMLQGDYVEK